MRTKVWLLQQSTRFDLITCNTTLVKISILLNKSIITGMSDSAKRDRNTSGGKFNSAGKFCREIFRKFLVQCQWPQATALIDGFGQFFRPPSKHGPGSRQPGPALSVTAVTPASLPAIDPPLRKAQTSKRAPFSNSAAFWQARSGVSLWLPPAPQPPSLLHSNSAAAPRLSVLAAASAADVCCFFWQCRCRRASQMMHGTHRRRSPLNVGQCLISFRAKLETV